MPNLWLIDVIFRLAPVISFCVMLSYDIFHMEEDFDLAIWGSCSQTLSNKPMMFVWVCIS